ncbi:MAG: alpha/beta hydrolase, partial [Bacteroidota bacterium]
PKLAGQLAYRMFTTPRNRAQHKVSDQIMEQAQLFEFMYGSKLLKGYEWGSGPKTCLLVHGWESRGTALRSFVPALVNEGYRVIAFDGPAHGHSDGKQTDLPHFGGAIRALLRREGKVEAIIAHSFGGASTVYTLANLVQDQAIESLVLIASPSRLDRVMERFARFVHLPPKGQEWFRKILEKRAKLRLEEASIGTAYSKVKVDQTLVIHDKLDQVVPFAEAETVFASWDHITLLVTEGEGHFKLVKNPKIIQRVTHFISQERA